MLLLRWSLGPPSSTTRSDPPPLWYDECIITTDGKITTATAPTPTHPATPWRNELDEWRLQGWHQHEGCHAAETSCATPSLHTPSSDDHLLLHPPPVTPHSTRCGAVSEHPPPRRRRLVKAVLWLQSLLQLLLLLSVLLLYQLLLLRMQRLREEDVRPTQLRVVKRVVECMEREG